MNILGNLRNYILFEYNAPFFQQQKKNQFSLIFFVDPTGEKNEKVLLSGFEPESKPRKGFMIGRYTTGAFIC